jgi:uncharacterized protein
MVQQQLSAQRRQMAAAAAAEYGPALDGLNWVAEALARQAQAGRAKLLATLATRLAIDFKQTKPHLGPLSPGCRICGEGRWSCLFINGKCNCRCFYCPTPQNEIGVPTTNQVPFSRASDYADYVGHFDFGGVSISGGEPLLTFERALKHIAAVRRKMGAGVHIWLYTNTTLLNETSLLKLRDAGLDEIRMDISAAGYSLEKAQTAVGIIPCVTVEIPAIPEDHRRLAALLPVMRDLGVNHLNLHQLRLTPHNLANFRNRPYTYLHGEKITVLESELTALALIQEACENGIGLPINYCAFVYKHRYQRAAARRRNARLVLKDHETITENGHIRSLAVAGTPQALARQAQELNDGGADRRLWQLTGSGSRLYFHPSLWPRIDAGAGDLLAGYAEAGLCANISYHHYFKEIRINADKRLYVEKRPVFKETRLDAGQRRWLAARLGGSPAGDPLDDWPAGEPAIAEFEIIAPGLQDYF